MDKREQRKRKMVKVRHYLKEKAHSFIKNFGVFLVIMAVFAVAYGICSVAINTVTHWLHFGTDDGNLIVSFIAGIVLAVWLLVNLKHLITFIEWWQKPEEDEEPRPVTQTPTTMTATFTGDVATGNGHIWLEVPIATVDGGDRLFYVRLYTDNDLCATVLRGSEGKELKVGGTAFMPDDDEREEYDLLLVVSNVSTVSREGVTA